MAKDPTHTSKIHVDCTPKQKARLAQTARRLGFGTVGDLVRHIIDAGMQFDDEPPPPGAPMLEALARLRDG